MVKFRSCKITFRDGNALAWRIEKVKISNFVVYLSDSCMPMSNPWRAQRMESFFFFVFVVVAGGWGESILPGLDRGASGDLSLQALKSDADLWKTKGTGRGTNMVLCLSEGRFWVLLWLRSLSVVCLRRSLAFFCCCCCSRGLLARCVGSSAGLKIGLWLFGVGSQYFYYYYFLFRSGIQVTRVLVSVTCRWCNPRFFWGGDQI